MALNFIDSIELFFCCIEIVKFSNANAKLLNYIPLKQMQQIKIILSILI
jgi:hypothetical protein